MEEMDSKDNPATCTGMYIPCGPAFAPVPTALGLSDSVAASGYGGQGDAHVERELTENKLGGVVNRPIKKPIRPPLPPPLPPPLTLNSQVFDCKVEYPGVESEEEAEVEVDSSFANIEIDPGRKWTTWAGGFHAKLALFALAMSAFVLTRFPVEISSGSVIVAYVLLMFLVIQPLVYFELLLGQLYLRRFSFRGITESDLFGGIASGLRTGTVVAAFLFLPSQLVSLNYAALLAWDISDIKQENDSRALCYSVLHSIDGGGESDSVFMNSVNWKLILPSLATLAIITLATIRRVPNLLAKFLVWLVVPCFVGLIYILRQELLVEQSTHPHIYSRMSVDLNVYSDLSLWATASKLAFLTSGAGLGILSTISSSHPRHFHQLYFASWIHVALISTVAIISTVCTFGEIGFLIEGLGSVNLTLSDTDMTTLPLMTFGSQVCRSPSQIFWWFALVFFVFQFILNSWPKFLINQAFIAAYIPHRLRRSNNICRAFLLTLAGPLIIISLESVYMLPVAKHILQDTDFFCGAWTICALTLIRVLAFVYSFSVDQLRLHVSQQIHRSNTLSTLFVIQLKYLLLPALLGMFIVLSVGLMEGLLPHSRDPEYPEWLKAIGCAMNSLPIMTVIICAILDLCGNIRRPVNPPSPPGPPRRITISSPQPLPSTRLAINQNDMPLVREDPRQVFVKPQFGSFEAKRQAPRAPPPGPPPNPPTRDASLYETTCTRPKAPSVPPPPPPPPKPLRYAESMIVMNMCEEREPDFPPPPFPAPLLAHDFPSGCASEEVVVIDAPELDTDLSTPVSPAEGVVMLLSEDVSSNAITIILPTI